MHCLPVIGSFPHDTCHIQVARPGGQAEAPLKSFITTFSPLLTDPGHDGHDFARRPSRAKRDTSIKKSFLDLGTFEKLVAKGKLVVEYRESLYR